jgi:hypothetical protein
MTPEEIAAGLPIRLRNAILSATEVQYGAYPARYEVTTARVWKSLIDKQLAYASGPITSWRPTSDRAVLNQRGLAVREILKGQDNAD